MGEYPKRLTEVFQTSDERVFGTEIQAKRHERKLVIRAAIQVARDAFHSFGPGRAPASREEFDDVVADELERSGILPKL